LEKLVILQAFMGALRWPSSEGFRNRARVMVVAGLAFTQSKHRDECLPDGKSDEYFAHHVERSTPSAGEDARRSIMKIAPSRRLTNEPPWIPHSSDAKCQEPEG
jgi:hypothetical protein